MISRNTGRAEIIELTTENGVEEVGVSDVNSWQNQLATLNCARLSRGLRTRRNQCFKLCYTQALLCSKHPSISKVPKVYNAIIVQGRMTWPYHLYSKSADWWFSGGIPMLTHLRITVSYFSMLTASYWKVRKSNYNSVPWIRDLRQCLCASPKTSSFWLFFFWVDKKPLKSQDTATLDSSLKDKR